MDNMTSSKSKSLFIIFIILLLIVGLSIVSAANNSNTHNTKNKSVSVAKDVTKKQVTKTSVPKVKKEVKNTTKALTKKNTTKKSAIKTAHKKTITITEDNARQYENYDFEDNTEIIIDTTLDDYAFDITKQNITIRGINGATLINSHITVTNNGNLTLTNLTMNSDDNSFYNEIVNIDSDNNIVSNMNFTDYKNSKSRDYSKVININGENNTVVNCSFNVQYLSKNIDWTNGGIITVAAITNYGNYNNISHNTFDVKELESDAYFGTIMAIHNKADNVTIDHNNITMDGFVYLYAIDVYLNNNTITNNKMSVISHRYANGIQITGKSSNNLVENNTVYVKSLGEEVFSGITDVAYGIILTEMDYHGGEYNIENSQTANNVIRGNLVMGSGTHMYGYEQFGGTNTTIADNVIDISGNYTMGMGVIGLNTVIENNQINSRGSTNLTDSSADYLRPQTSGVYVYYSNSTTIRGNRVNTYTGPAIVLEADRNANIHDNKFETRNNDYAVVSRRETRGARISNNTFRGSETLSLEEGNEIGENRFGYDPDEEENQGNSGSNSTIPNNNPNNNNPNTNNNQPTNNQPSNNPNNQPINTNPNTNPINNNPNNPVNPSNPNNNNPVNPNNNNPVNPNNNNPNNNNPNNNNPNNNNPTNPNNNQNTNPNNNNPVNPNNNNPTNTNTQPNNDKPSQQQNTNTQPTNPQNNQNKNLTNTQPTPQNNIPNNPETPIPETDSAIGSESPSTGAGDVAADSSSSDVSPSSPDVSSTPLAFEVLKKQLEKNSTIDYKEILLVLVGLLLCLTYGYKRGTQS